MRVWKEKGRGVYGARKVWRELRREGIEVARCTVERLMRELGIAGAAARRRRQRTTVPAGPGHERPSDLLERYFTASAEPALVADITYVETASGSVYASFILGLFSRKIVGWQVSDNFRAELVLDALEMAVWSRGDRMEGNLVGRKGDFDDNAAAEALNSLYKKELIERDGPWSGTADVMLATLEWVAWYNSKGYILPAVMSRPMNSRKITTQAGKTW